MPSFIDNEDLLALKNSTKRNLFPIDGRAMPPNFPDFVRYYIIN